jgi:GR25 family glycosyltransferase involved in LPS biosynthesis
MLAKKLPPVLILESDAAWDIDLRPIMALFNDKFTRLLQQLNSTPIYADRSSSESSGEDRREQPLQPNPEDPWHSDHWDILSLGHCFDSQKSETSYLKYEDQYVPEGKDYFGQKLGHERVVHQSGGFACTTAYAITQRGAAKLLLRTAHDFNWPVDLVIKSMIANGELVAYTTIPTIMAQWNYVEGIGMGDRGANSDIQGTRYEKSANKVGLLGNHTMDLSGWDDAKKSKSGSPNPHTPTWRLVR